MRVFFHILSFTFVMLFVLAAALLVISSFTLPFFPLDVRSVLTGSMEPAIPTGSLVFTYPQAEYVPGDIITFRPDGNRETVTITHRIEAASENEAGETIFTTKGDANNMADFDPVRERDVVGQVIFHLPYLGRLLDLAKTPWGFAALIIIPAALVIADEVKKIVAATRRKEEEDGEATNKEDA